MRKWVLFLLLAAAIGGAALWHSSRTASTVPGVDSSGNPIAATQEWTPEQLRETQGEIVVGGNAPTALPATPQDAATPPLSKAPVAKTAEAVKPPELLAQNAGAEKNVGEESYVVQKGDTLGAIAKKKYGSAAPKYVDAIVKKNSLKNATSLKIGAKLVLPAAATVGK